MALERSSHLVSRESSMTGVFLGSPRHRPPWVIAQRSQISLALLERFRFSSGFHLRTLRSLRERDPPLPLLPQIISPFSAPSPTAGLQPARVSAPAPREFSPPAASQGSRVCPRG